MVLTMAMLTALLALAALAIDTGHLYNMRAEVQTVADASALAGASALFEDPYGVIERAVDVAGRNRVANRPASIDAERLQIGYWDTLAGTFTPVGWSFANSANAVRVVSRQQNVPSYFGGIVGINNYAAAREAIAHKVPPCSGVWGLDSVLVSGSMVTDSYDSSEGPYRPELAGTDGDLCSNGAIDVTGSAEVYGDASAGPGYSVNIEGNGTVSGATTPGDHLLELPMIWPDDVEEENDNDSIGLTVQGRSPFQPGPLDLYVSGGPDNLTLEPGTYFFTSISIRSQATLTIHGPVTIYVTGDVAMGGGAIVNATADPQALTIYSTGSTLELHGGSGFYGNVIAPFADVKLIGTSTYYGAIVGRIIEALGTATVHVDRSLDLVTRLGRHPYLVQ